MRKRDSKKRVSTALAVRQRVESSSSEDSSADDEKRTISAEPQDGDVPAYYWSIQKLVKCLRIGNQTATVLCLCALKDHPIDEEACQRTIKQLGGLEVLINILETNDTGCMVQSLKVLRVISSHPEVRRAIVSMRGLQTMVKLLDYPSDPLKALVSETIANVAMSHKARLTVRHSGGIPKLVGLLDVEQPILLKAPADLNSAQQEKLEVARGGAQALWSLAKSTKVKEAIRETGGIALLARLLKCVHTELLISIIGIIRMCATEESYRQAIKIEGMTQDLLGHLKKPNIDLQIHCAHAIFQCAEDSKVRAMVRQEGGLKRLVAMLQSTEATTNPEVVVASTGALWKCAYDAKNAESLEKMGIVGLLVPLLESENLQILINTAGAIGACAQLESIRSAVKSSSGIQPLIRLLIENNHTLLVNAVHAIGACARSAECMAVIESEDGVRLVWSLLKSNSSRVQAAAAWAVRSCIQNARDTGDMVSSFVGGLELIVNLLGSTETEVLAAVCSAIAEIAKDESNLAVMTDHGVVRRLAALANTDNDQVRQHLAQAVARTCPCDDNRLRYGQHGVVPPLVRYLHSTQAEVHQPAAMALCELSREPRNCVTMHQHNVVGPLLQMCGSQDHQLQDYAAECLRNIRLLAIAFDERAKQGKQPQAQQGSGDEPEQAPPTPAQEREAVQEQD